MTDLADLGTVQLFPPLRLYLVVATFRDVFVGVTTVHTYGFRTRLSVEVATELVHAAHGVGWEVEISELDPTCGIITAEGT